MAEIRPPTPQRYTCAGCDKTWRPLGACHCSSCHETFTGVRWFDSHRKYGKCVDPATLKTKGKPLVKQDEAGLWRDAVDFTKASTLW